MPAMVTDQEIQREIDTLRSLRRRSASSTGPGALPLDPDLPPPSSNHSTSPTNSYSQSPWSTSPPHSGHLTRTSRQYSFGNDVQDGAYGSTPPLSPGSYHLGSAVSSSDDYVLGTPTTVDSHGGADHQALGGALPPAPGDDPTHLFWVPAHLHPELAPGHFRAFLKQHTSDDPTADGEAIDGGLVRKPSSGSAPGLARTPSWLSRAPSMHAAREEGGGGGGASGLGRKRSMLSKQYHPRAGDKVEDEVVPSMELGRRGSTNRSSIYGGLYGEKGLTLQDLQKLEVMADQAAESDDPGKMRDLLRSGLSLDMSPEMLDQTATYGSDGQAYDSPILLPPPNQIIRRNARTKIRKPGELGLGSTRGRGRHVSGNQSPGEVINDEDPIDSRPVNRLGDMSRVTLHDGPPSPQRKMSDHSDGSEEMYSAEEGFAPDEATKRGLQGFSNDGRHRPSHSVSPGSDIYGAYDRTEDTVEGDTSVESMTSSNSQGLESTDESNIPLSPRTPQEEDKYAAEVVDEEDVWRQKTPTLDRSHDPNRQFIVGGRQDQGRYSPPSSPETVRDRQQDQYQPPSPITAYNQLLSQNAVNGGDGRAQSPGPKDRMEALRAEVAEPPHRTLEKQQSQERLRKEKEKDKKGGFFSKKKEKGTKEKEGFLGSLFGSKKKQEEPAPLKFSSAGPAAAAALLGQSKSAKSIGLIPMSGSSPTSPGFAPYARYPIHVERAVYRLSHIKLANPRRPLYEQVLISNLMFWYLSIINRSANPSPAVAEEKDKPQGSVPAPPERKASAQPATPPLVVLTTADQSQQEANKSGSLRTVPAQNSSAKAGGSSAGPAPPSSPEMQVKRTGLTKAPEQRPGPQPGRRAEMPVRPPQYGIQNMQIDQEANRFGQSAGRSGPPQQMPSQGSAPQPTGGFPPRPPPPQTGNSQHSAPPQSRRRQPSPSNAPSPAPSYQNHLTQHAIQSQQHQQRASPRGQENSPPGRNHAAPPEVLQGGQPSRNLPSAQSSHNLAPDSMRRVASDRPVIQTQGLPGSHAGPEHMDRRVTDGYPSGSRSPRPAGYPSPGGVQPGQVFQYPGGPSGVQPGQVFPRSASPGALPVGQNPGQVFQHPQYTPYMNPQQGAQLPPGAMPPRAAQVPQSGWSSPTPPPGAGPRQSNSGGSHQNEAYDQQYQGGLTQQRSFSGSNGPPYGQPYPDPHGGARSVSAQSPGRAASPSQHHAYPHPSQQPQQQQQSNAPYNPYLRQAGPLPGQGGHPSAVHEQGRGGSDDSHGSQYARRAPQQPVQGYERR